MSNQIDIKAIAKAIKNDYKYSDYIRVCEGLIGEEATSEGIEIEWNADNGFLGLDEFGATLIVKPEYDYKICGGRECDREVIITGITGINSIEILKCGGTDSITDNEIELSDAQLSELEKEIMLNLYKPEHRRISQSCAPLTHFESENNKVINQQ